MQQNQHHRSTSDRQVGLSIESSRRVVAFGSIAKATVARAFRFPLATAVGTGATLVAYSTITAWVSDSASLPGTSILGLFSGTALFLALASFMVLDEGRLNHAKRLFRTGAFVSIIVTIVGAIPMLIGSLLLPPDWQSLAQWQFLVDHWLIASMGLGAICAGCVLPAFLVAWPIHASTGEPLSQCILFVWYQIEDHSYAGTSMTLFVALVGLLIFVLPVTGIAMPVLFAHLAVVLFDDLVIVNVQ